MLRLNLHPLQPSLVWFPSPVSVLFGNTRFFLTNSFHPSRCLTEALCKTGRLCCSVLPRFASQPKQVEFWAHLGMPLAQKTYYAFFWLRQTPFQVVSISLCCWRWQELQRGRKIHGFHFSVLLLHFAQGHLSSLQSCAGPERSRKPFFLLCLHTQLLYQKGLFFCFLWVTISSR